MLERTMGRVIQDISRGFRVLLLTGPRQVGKTTLLTEIAEKERRYVSLDNMKFRILAQQDPELFLQQFPPPVLIDEVQYAPELFPFIKIYVDTHREEKGAFWLTGSQKYPLMKGIGESLAGRIAILDLLGLSEREKRLDARGSRPFLPRGVDDPPEETRNPLRVDEVYRRIWEGSLPEPVTDPRINREIFYSSYIQSYIERDVRDFYAVEKPVQFYNFLSAVAARTGNLVNYHNLADDIGIDLKTAQAWMGILERSGLVYLLRPYSPNVTKRIIKTPKLYFLDTGLCAYLTRWNTPESLSAGAMDGAILETWCFCEILKSYWYNGKEPHIYFYRDTDQKEIDFIIEQDMTLFPVEVKKHTRPGPEAVKHFGVLSKLGKPVGMGAVLCLGQSRFPINREAMAVPLWEI